MAQSKGLAEELRIAGKWLPKQVAALEAQVNATELRGRVRHDGFVPAEELPALMRDATALVVPSLMEGFGLPVAEGLAVGAMVIHSHLPVLEETSHGAALTFDPHSAVDLAACLHRAVTDKDMSEALRKQGRERATQITWDDAVKTTLATYEGILRE
jgi:glycosyltransferase involved in cell wall biosynthesis